MAGLLQALNFLSNLFNFLNTHDALDGVSVATTTATCAQLLMPRGTGAEMVQFLKKKKKNQNLGVF